MQTLKITKSLIQRQSKWIDVQSIWFLFCLFFGLFFGLFTLFFRTKIGTADCIVTYNQGNVFFHSDLTSQIVFLMNPFLVTATVFAVLVYLSVIYFWFDYLIKHFYLTKLYKSAIIFDNAYFNQLLVYIICFYVPLWLTICPNYYEINQAFSFYDASMITSGAIVYAFFFILFTLYLGVISLFRINKDLAKQFVYGGMGMKKILVFGLTGSIGQNVLKVIDQNQKTFTLIGASFNKNAELMQKILQTHAHLKYYYSPNNEQLSNCNSWKELIKSSQPDLIVNALTGFAGVEISLLAIENKIDLALANKESLVVAGALLIKKAQENDVKIWPIDSEHSNLKLLIDAYKQENIKKLYITCSGGPFYWKNAEELKQVTYQEAIQHPTWKMGPKISVDSATLINKAFEIIEAYWLFQTTNIEALYHPQSKVHALIELKNHEIISGLSVSDMLLPIQLALNNYQTNQALISAFSFSNCTLTFDELNSNKWEALQLPNLYFDHANTTLGTILCVLDEIAIRKFANKQLKFDEIVPFIFSNYQKFALEELKNWTQIQNLKDEIEKRLDK